MAIACVGVVFLSLATVPRGRVPWSGPPMSGEDATLGWLGVALAAYGVTVVCCERALVRRPAGSATNARPMEPGSRQV